MSPFRFLVTGACKDFGPVYQDMEIHVIQKPFKPEDMAENSKKADRAVEGNGDGIINNERSK